MSLLVKQEVLKTTTTGSFLLLALVDQQITFSYLLQYQPRREGRLLQPPPRLRPRKCVPVGTRVPSGHAHRTHVCMQFGSALGYAVCIPAQAGRGSPQPPVPVSTLQGAALFQARVGSGARGAAISLGLSAEELGSSPGCERGGGSGGGGPPGAGGHPSRPAGGPAGGAAGWSDPARPSPRGQPAAGTRWPPPAPPRRGALAAGCAGGAAVPGPQTPHGSRGGLRRPPPPCPGAAAGAARASRGSCG